MRFGIIALIAALAAQPAFADGFDEVQDKNTFVSLIADRNLTRFGINVTVTPDGQIVGKAFGRAVTGAWQWSKGYFCRDLYWGERDLGPNCQAVKVQGKTVRFISDRGRGQFADLVLK